MRGSVQSARQEPGLCDPDCAGDFKVAKDGGALANLTTLPSVAPASSVLVTISLSSTEMNADVVSVVCVDQTAPKEWADFVISIPTTA